MPVGLWKCGMWKLPRNQVDESLYETVGEGNRSKDKKGGDDW